MGRGEAGLGLQGSWHRQREERNEDAEDSTTDAGHGRRTVL